MERLEVSSPHKNVTINRGAFSGTFSGKAGNGQAFDSSRNGAGQVTYFFWLQRKFQPRKIKLLFWLRGTECIPPAGIAGHQLKIEVRPCCPFGARLC